MPNADTLNVTFSVWDLGQDLQAEPGVLGNASWECSLGFSRVVPVRLVGSTLSSLPASAASGLFAVRFEGQAVNVEFVASCTSPELGRCCNQY